jgi:hypothetical protein
MDRGSFAKIVASISLLRGLEEDWGSHSGQQKGSKIQNESENAKAHAICFLADITERSGQACTLIKKIDPCALSL